MKKTTRIRELLARPGIVVMPGVYDALGARIVEEAGFECCYISGFAVEASYGLPDMGILTMTEVTARAASIAQAVNIPVFCDADTGYGNAVNVIRTVREFERSGIAGIHLEDQAMPKQCGAFTDLRLISQEEMVGKIRAALDARTDPDFVIIARTDAAACVGIDEAVKRGQAYADAGADLIMFAILRSIEDLRTVCTSFSKPTLLCASDSGIQPILSFPELEAMGCKVALCPTLLMTTAITAMRRAARDLKELGTLGPIKERNDSRESVLQLLGYENFIAVGNRYGR